MSYHFDRILNKAIHPQTGKQYYLVKWTNYLVSQSTWEPKENLNNPKQSIERYERHRKHKYQRKVINIPKPWQINQQSSPQSLQIVRQNKKVKKNLGHQNGKKNIRKRLILQAKSSKRSQKKYEKRSNNRVNILRKQILSEKFMRERDNQFSKILKDLSQEELIESQEYSRIYNQPDMIKIEDD